MRTLNVRRDDAVEPGTRERRLPFRVATEGRPPSVTKSEYYRMFARECLAMAQAAEDERARAALTHMAQVWLRLSENKRNAANENEKAEDRC